MPPYTGAFILSFPAEIAHQCGPSEAVSSFEASPIDGYQRAAGFENRDRLLGQQPVSVIGICINGQSRIAGQVRFFPQCRPS